MSWIDGRLCVFDTETTGKDPETARIVTACVAMVGGEKTTDVRSWLVNPGVDIPAEATGIHGVTTEQARDGGIDPAKAVHEIGLALCESWSYGHPMVVMNAQYDLTLMDREARRHTNMSFPVRGPVVDPMVIDKHYDKYRRGKRRLVELAAHYGVALDKAHEASSDALAAGRIVWRQCQMWPELRTMELDDLHHAQVEWYREQQEGFMAYRRGRGEPTDDIHTDWPQR